MKGTFKLIQFFFLLLFVCNTNAQKDLTAAFRAKTDSLESLAYNYQELNGFSSAFELYEKAYHIKKNNFPEQHLSILKTLMRLSYSGLHTEQHEKAKEYLNKAIAEMNLPNDYKGYKTFSMFVKGCYLIKANEFDKAFRQFDDYYQKEWISQKGRKKSAEHINALITVSQYHAFYGNAEKAFDYGNTALNYSKNNGLTKSIVGLRAIRELANITTGLGNYDKGLKLSEEGLSLAIEMLQESPKKKLHANVILPYLLWVNARSKYLSQEDLELDSLKQLSDQLAKGLTILDSTRLFLTNQNDITLLLAKHHEYFELVKQWYLELYQRTSDNRFLQKLIIAHESKVYQRIRLRLKARKLEPNHLPDNWSKSENLLLQNLFSALFQDSTTTDVKYSRRKWLLFLDSLKVAYPKYHQLKYGPLLQSVGDLKKKVDNNTTIVRYLYVQQKPYAYVINSSSTSFIELSNIQMDFFNNELHKLHQNEQTLKILHFLYLKLWEPIEKYVSTSKVVIIPDGPLFNLGFETLTKTKVNALSEIQQESLLNVHDISYNYSLFLINTNQNILEFDKDYVAFAPGFNDQMKKDYQLAVIDSTLFDQTYLTLLPQPFNAKLAKKYAQKFKGTSFLNERASKQLFSKTGKEHKIIHIGTHAESNNQNPELSRLVFAKNISDSTNVDDNYLYTYEIFNQNLSSNLAILTACETGKPTFQPGEGMISLAHAFNYAGSESILTSLWQIDEQSSTQILEYFFENLEEGNAKDEALRLAKLEYLQLAEGRTLHPQYWAGMVLMGDTSPIALAKENNPIWMYILFGIIALGLLSWFFFKRYRKFN